MAISQSVLKDYLDPAFRVSVFEEVDSTNRLARTAAEENAAEFTTIIANSQTQGKGRKGRSFFSPADTGLYVSIVLYPTREHSPLHITTAAAVAVAKAIEETADVTTSIKWVNDIYCRGKKVCGILAEGAYDADRLQYVVLGIGVNVTEPTAGFPSDIQMRAGAVFDAKQPLPMHAKERLAAAVLNRFLSYYQSTETKVCLSAYRERNFLLGKTVNVIGVDDRIQESVTVLDVTDDFELLVRDASGSVRALSSGEVSLQL